jgi:hypothetical protein
MGVSADFLGKQVRCPHCRQVVLAPSAATAPGAPMAPPPPAPAPRPQPVATEPDLPQFSVPAAREGTDSILGDPNESEDDVFGTQPGTRLITGPFDPQAQQTPVPPPAPPRPAPLPDLEVTTTPENPFALAQTEPTGIPRSSLPQLPRTTELTNPFPDLEPVSMPGTFAPVAQPPAPPPPAPPRAAPQPVLLPASYPTTAPVGAPSNPFAGIDESVVVAPPPAPAPVAERTEPVAEPRTARRSDSGEAPIARPPRRGPATKPASGGGGGANPVLLYVVLGWAVLATLLAVYGLVFRYGTRIDPGHPLSTIPDNYGEFGPAQRKNTGSVRVDGNLELPANQRAQLNQTIRVGQLEVTPKEIVRRRLVLVEDRGAGERQPQPRGTALVMKLEIKNRSTVPLFPMDPAFLRTSDPQNQPLTRLVVGRQTFYGGAIPWPFAESIKRRREVQQQNDYEPLAPDEPRDYIVFTDDQKPDIVKAVSAAREPLQWRVQVRSGLLDLEGKQYPITSVFAVDFRASDITNPAG